jgi:hypothetical protein
MEDPMTPIADLISLVAAVLASIGAPATALEPAVRGEQTVIDVRPVDVCALSEAYTNSLTYTWGDLEPPRAAYRSVAGCLGWTPDQIRRWEFFAVDDVINGESGGCWNVYRKAIWTGNGCDFRYPDGSGQDAGFFQLIGVWHGPDGYLCVNFGTCGREAVTASPFSSMISGLRALMHDGSRPWCYSDAARSYHRGCSTVPRNFG